MFLTAHDSTYNFTTQLHESQTTSNKYASLLSKVNGKCLIFSEFDIKERSTYLNLKFCSMVRGLLERGLNREGG